MVDHFIIRAERLCAGADGVIILIIDLSGCFKGSTRSECSVAGGRWAMFAVLVSSRNINQRFSRTLSLGITDASEDIVFGGWAEVAWID